MTDLSHLLEEPDIHEVYLERLRAEYLTKTLWQITHARILWSKMPLTPLEVKSGGGEGGPSSGGFQSRSPAFVEFEVPAVAVLVFRGERWRLWKNTYRQALQGLSPDEHHALREHMLNARYSSVFAVNHRQATVRRSVSADWDLAKAALKILGASEQLKS